MNQVIDEEQARAIIEELYFSEYHRLFRIACITFSKEDSEDIVHELFHLVCSKPEKLMKSPNRVAWLLVALRYVGRNYKKKYLRKNLSSLDEEEAPEIRDDRAQAAFDEVILNEFLNHSSKFVSKETIDMIRLSLQGYKSAEIARMYNKTPDACKKQMLRGRKKIALHMDDIWD